MVSRLPTRIVILVTSAFGGIGGIEPFNRALLHALDGLASRHGWSVQILSLLDAEQAPGADSYGFPKGKVPHELLLSYYAACDIFVLPSLREGFGIVFLEAMYHGKACIGANAGGVAEVHDRVAGLLVDESNIPTRLPEAILRLLTDEALRKTMGERGRNELSKFSFGQFRDRLEQILCGSCATTSDQPAYSSKHA
jgi:Glycosyl transferases group 1